MKSVKRCDLATDGRRLKLKLLMAISPSTGSAIRQETELEVGPSLLRFLGHMAPENH